MKTALSSILGLLLGRSLRDNDIPADRTYCSCGALMPTKKRDSEASMQTKRPFQGVPTAGK